MWRQRRVWQIFRDTKSNVMSKVKKCKSAHSMWSRVFSSFMHVPISLQNAWLSHRCWAFDHMACDFWASGILWMRTALPLSIYKDDVFHQCRLFKDCFTNKLGVLPSGRQPGKPNDIADMSFSNHLTVCTTVKQKLLRTIGAMCCDPRASVARSPWVTAEPVKVGTESSITLVDVVHAADADEGASENARICNKKITCQERALM